MIRRNNACFMSLLRNLITKIQRSSFQVVDDGENEILVEGPPHSCSDPAQSEYAEVDETAG